MIYVQTSHDKGSKLEVLPRYISTFDDFCTIVFMLRRTNVIVLIFSNPRFIYRQTIQTD